MVRLDRKNKEPVSRYESNRVENSKANEKKAEWMGNTWGNISNVVVGERADKNVSVLPDTSLMPSKKTEIEKSSRRNPE